MALGNAFALFTPMARFDPLGSRHTVTWVLSTLATLDLGHDGGDRRHQPDGI